MEQMTIDAKVFSDMVRSGAGKLKEHVQEVNDLNVFPIPDGDTGENMLLTMLGGAGVKVEEDEDVGSASRRIADGMLLSARGNSGVILSQFFDGIAAGLSGERSADAGSLATAFGDGVEHASAAVMEPTEGTILTVAREATDFAAKEKAASPADFLGAFLREARDSLERTPDLLAVLKKAGVVDSGGAGLIYIVEGMLSALGAGSAESDFALPAAAPKSAPDLDRFTEDSVLEFGYCTELLLRLQNAKCDVKAFQVSVVSDYLSTIGDSIVAVKTGSVVKIHVHTKTPQKVLEFCQRYGEFLTVKIENMTLQHNSLPQGAAGAEPEKERKRYAVVAVASGEGIKSTFRDMGADEIVDGGQSMNPSADDFLAAFDRANADVIFVLPNNGNIILAARQAASMYPASDVRVINSKTIGDGYAALTMLNTESGDTDEIERELAEAMEGVVTALVSRCSRDAEMDGFSLHTGQYIGFEGKEILSADNDRFDTACMLADKLDFDAHAICILIRGQDSTEEEAERIVKHITAAHRSCEAYVIDGGQDVYSYIMIAE